MNAKKLKMLTPGCLTFLIFACCFSVNAQKKLPVLRTDSSLITYRVGAEYHHNRWTISPTLHPDMLEVLVKEKPVPVSFISATDSITFMVEGGKNYDFLVLKNNSKDSAYTRVKGIRYVKPANFTSDYIRKNDGKTLVEITPVYELINILYALTPTGKKDKNIVERQTTYYREVMDWFTPYENDPLIGQIDTALKLDQYFILKMDAYAFDMPDRKILQSAVYDRVSWRDTNTLRPYIPAMERFAQKSRFADFYKKHKPLYDAQINCYTDSINTGQMVGWLRSNFPATTYNTFKIVFSPLVSANQSANWFEDNHFKEAHAHINFPYVTAEARKKWTADALLFRRGFIAFTEINHSFVNPETDRHIKNEQFIKAFKNLDGWIDSTKTARNYADPLLCFNEYMNWGLVSLYAVDYAPPAEVQKIVDWNGENMEQGRGFKKFKAFNAYLVNTYRLKKEKQTLTDLYPEIINWFPENR